MMPLPVLAFERQVRSDHANEHAALFDAQGQLVVARTGHPTDTTFETDFTEQELNQACGGIVTHNHPRGKPFSRDDLALAARWYLTIRAVGSTPDGESYEYTATMPGASSQMADEIYQRFDDDVEQAKQELANKGYNDWKLEREARDQVIRNLASLYGFTYLRVQRDVTVSEASRAEKARLDVLTSIEVAMRHEVWQPLHAQIVRVLARQGNAVPLDRMMAVRADVARLVTRTMLGAASSDGTLVPYRIQHGQVVSHSPYFKTLLDAMRTAAQAAVDQHARIMRKYLPADLVRAYEFATISPFDSTLSEIDDPLHDWLGEDGKRLSDRIWQATGEMRARLDRYLAEAISTNKPVSQMAHELEQFLVEGRGSYEAMRLARTEVAFAHSRADFAAAQHNPFVEQYEFFTAPTHQCCDECDEVEKNSPYDKDDQTHMPPQHPNCICGTRWIVVDQPSTVVDKIREQVAQAVASAKQAITDVVGPLSRRFVDLLFRARS